MYVTQADVNFSYQIKIDRVRGKTFKWFNYKYLSILKNPEISKPAYIIFHVLICEKVSTAVMYYI